MERKRTHSFSDLQSGAFREQKNSIIVEDNNCKRKKVSHVSSDETDSSSDSDSTSSQTSLTKQKKSSKKKKEDHKRKHAKKEKKRKKSKKKHKKHKSDHGKIDRDAKAKPAVGPAPVESKDLPKAARRLSASSSADTASRRLIAPMTKAEWEKQQSVVRRVRDPTTGRDRLIKGDGEVLEEIVTKERHKKINKQSTYMDGIYYASQQSQLYD